MVEQFDTEKIDTLDTYDYRSKTAQLENHFRQKDQNNRE